MKHIKPIKNWGKTFEYTPRTMYIPETEEALIETIQSCQKAGEKVRPLGSRYSYTPLICSNEVALSLDKFNGIEEVNREALTVTVRGGRAFS